MHEAGNSCREIWNEIANEVFHLSRLRNRVSWISNQHEDRHLRQIISSERFRPPTTIVENRINDLRYKMSMRPVYGRFRSFGHHFFIYGENYHDVSYS